MKSNKTKNNIAKSVIDEEHDELDMSLRCIALPLPKISEEHKKLIDEIKNKYNYNGNLLQHIYDIHAHITKINPNIKRQNGRPSKHKKQYNNVIKKLEELQKEINRLSPNNQRALILRAEKQIFKFESSPLIHIEKNIVPLIRVIYACEKNVGDDLGGVGKGDTASVIELLAVKYEYNTGKEAKCWKKADVLNKGEVFEFITELRPIFDEIGIDLTPDGNIAKNIKKFRSIRKKRRIEKLKSIIDVLTFSEFLISLNHRNENYLNEVMRALCLLINEVYFMRSPDFMFTMLE